MADRDRRSDIGQKLQEFIDWKWLAAVALLATLVAGIAYRQSHVVVRFALTSDVTGRVQVFHDAHGAFSESASSWTMVSAGQPSMVVLDVHGDAAAQLRIDPPAGSTMQSCGLTINGLPADGQLQLVDATTMDAVVGTDCVRMQVPQSAEDPHASLALTGQAAHTMQHAQRWWQVAMAAGLPALALWVWLGWLALHRQQWSGELSASLTWADANAHRWLACLMLGFGIGYLLLTPPGAVPDEPAHLAKIVRIGAGIPFGDSGTALLPNIIVGYEDFNDYLSKKQAFTYRHLTDVVTQPLHCETTDAILPRSANGYFPHQYLLPALVLDATCAAHASFGTFLYLSRLLNLLLATCLVVAGVRFAERGRWALFLAALLPMSMFELASISADSLSIALAIAWLGLLSGIHGGRLSLAKAMPWLYGLSFSLALCKGGSVWMLAALLFCRNAFEREGRPFVPALAKFVLLPLLAGFAWSWHAADMLAIRAGVDRAANMHLLSTDPVGYCTLFIRTIEARGARLWQTLIGALGWLDVRLPPSAYLLASIAVPLSLWSNGGDRLSLRIRCSAVVLALFATLLVGVPLFLYWTLPGSPQIEGLQGRYFLAPLAFVLVWCSFRASAQLRAACVGWIVATVLWINVAALQALYLAYFVIGRTG